MRKNKGLIIGLAAIIMTFTAASCQKEDNTLRYDNVTMGNIVDGTFVSDQGNIFNVAEQTCYGKLDTMGRAFIVCDVLRNTVSGGEKEFDIRLNYMTKVLTKDALQKSEIENMETYPNDALILEDLWISGGYMNLYFAAPIKRNSNQKHEINLIYEYDLEKETYKFYLRHNAFGEILKDDGSNGDMVMAGGYVSFPVNSIIKEDESKFMVEWNSYTISGSLISAQTQTYSIERTYKKSAYEHVPQTAVATASLELE